MTGEASVRSGFKSSQTRIHGDGRDKESREARSTGLVACSASLELSFDRSLMGDGLGFGLA